jgi:hypothetical protein
MNKIQNRICFIICLPIGERWGDDEQNDVKGKYATKKSEIDQEKEMKKIKRQHRESGKMECVSNIYR